MPQPIKLTYAEVVEAGRKAYLEKRLSAQGPTPECQYRDRSGRPCVVGSALSDTDAQRLHGTVQALVLANELAVDDVAAIGALQLAHDDWARGVMGRGRHSPNEAETRLRKLLNIEEAA